MIYKEKNAPTQIKSPHYVVEESQSLLVLDYVINFYDTRFQIRYIFCDFLNFECYFYPSSFYRDKNGLKYVYCKNSA